MTKLDYFDQPIGTIYIEIRHIYDGVSVAQHPDGSLHNLWPKESRRYQLTQEWIEQQEKKNDPPNNS